MPIVSETSDCVPVLKPDELPTSRYRRRDLTLMSRPSLLPASDLERSVILKKFDLHCSVISFLLSDKTLVQAR
jgi:hypothetical protein